MSHLLRGWGQWLWCPFTGPGLLPLLGTTPGLRSAAAPPLVGDRGRCLSRQLVGLAGTLGCRGGLPTPAIFPLRLLSWQITTLVSSAFLIVKVILSEVSGFKVEGWASLWKGFLGLLSVPG